MYEGNFLKMLKGKLDKTCALVLGGHVNGYSIIKELYEQDIKEIALFDSGKSIARFSNKVVYRAKIDKSAESLLKEIKILGLLRKLKRNQKY